MKKLLFCILIGLTYPSIRAQHHFRDTTQGFTFEINYWFNLHHFLWLESFVTAHLDSTLIQQDLSGHAKQNLEQALAYYREHLVSLDLKRSDYMSTFKRWITHEGRTLGSVPQQFQEHVHVLKSVDEVYKKSFWPVHKEACEKVLRDNIALIRQTEAPFVKSITRLTRQFWQVEKIKVDISYYGTASNWNPKHRPYTTLFPTHVVMTAVGENNVPGNWVELLFHESAHHLILSSSYFVGGTIKDVCEVMQLEPPRSFWHAYLFYLTGEVCKQAFTENNMTYEETYMQRTGVFGRYYALLDEHLKAYIKREVTLEEATRKILTALNQ